MFAVIANSVFIFMQFEVIMRQINYILVYILKLKRY